MMRKERGALVRVSVPKQLYTLALILEHRSANMESKGSLFHIRPM
jgi:hypothetical protein